jgi:uncharacterized protein YbaR (Trm112 family)
MERRGSGETIMGTEDRHEWYPIADLRTDQPALLRSPRTIIVGYRTGSHFFDVVDGMGVMMPDTFVPTEWAPVPIDLFDAIIG